MNVTLVLTVIVVAAVLLALYWAQKEPSKPARIHVRTRLHQIPYDLPRSEWFRYRDYPWRSVESLSDEEE